MTEIDLVTLARSTSAAYAGLFGQVISINFAMVVAIYYFLNRSGLAMKLLAYIVYLIGMFMFIGLLLHEANVRMMALGAMRSLPPDQTSSFTRGYLDLQDSWLTTATSIFLNATLWVLIATITVLLFAWRKPAER